MAVTDNPEELRKHVYRQLVSLATSDITDVVKLVQPEDPLYGQARERAKEILATHKQKNPLSPEQVKAIRDVLVDAEGELGVADFWKGKEEKRFIDNDLY